MEGNTYSAGYLLRILKTYYQFPLQMAVTEVGTRRFIRTLKRSDMNSRYRWRGPARSLLRGRDGSIRRVAGADAGFARGIGGEYPFWASGIFLVKRHPRSAQKDTAR